MDKHNIDHEFEQRERDNRPKRKGIVEQRVKAERQRERAAYVRDRRIVELRRLYRARYGYTLPDNAAGRRAIEVMAHHIKALDKIRNWCEVWAPWLPANELEAVCHDVVRFPQTWKADALGHLLHVTDAERGRLHLRTIRACDVSNADRLARRREQKRKREASRRLSAGATPRAESASRTKPWEAFGISRRTWQRRGKPMPGRGFNPMEAFNDSTGPRQNCAAAKRPATAPRGAAPDSRSHPKGRELQPDQALGAVRHMPADVGAPRQTDADGVIDSVAKIRAHYRSFASIYTPRSCDSGSAAGLSGAERAGGARLAPEAVYPESKRLDPGNDPPAWRERQGVLADGDPALRTGEWRQ